MKYLNYSASCEFSPEDQVFYGKVSGITDLVTFEAGSIHELELAFQQSVDDYLETCQELNKVPESPAGRHYCLHIPTHLHLVMTAL